MHLVELNNTTEGLCSFVAVLLLQQAAAHSKPRILEQRVQRKRQLEVTYARVFVAAIERHSCQCPLSSSVFPARNFPSAQRVRGLLRHLRKQTKQTWLGANSNALLRHRLGLVNVVCDLQARDCLFPQLQLRE